MQIKADREGAQVIKNLCDLALRAGGLQNMGLVARVLKDLDHPDKPEPGPDKKPDPEKE